MDAASALMTIAQLAMSLTGFAGLLIVFRLNKDRWERVEVHALRFLFRSSIGAFIAALLPLPMMIAGGERDVLGVLLPRSGLLDALHGR